MKRQLKNDAEKILEFMINRPTGMQFGTRPEIITALNISEDKYEKACQFLEDFELIAYRSNVGMLWGDIKPTQRGRQVMHEKSLESLLLAQSPIVNFHQGDQINVTNTGENVAIAAGRQSSATQGLTGGEIETLFRVIFDRVDQLKLPSNQHEDVKKTVELIESEVKKGSAADEKTLQYYFRILAKMAPDILDVVIATATNPLLGAATIIKKIAEKMKADAQGSQ